MDLHRVYEALALATSPLLPSSALYEWSLPSTSTAQTESLWAFPVMTAWRLRIRKFKQMFLLWRYFCHICSYDIKVTNIVPIFFCVLIYIYILHIRESKQHMTYWVSRISLNTMIFKPTSFPTDDTISFFITEFKKNIYIVHFLYPLLSTRLGL